MADKWTYQIIPVYLADTAELLAAEGLTIGTGCTNVIQTRGGTSPRTGTEI